MRSEKMNNPTELQNWLASFLSRYHASAGTIHLFENGGLRLASAINIPPPVQQIVDWVPYGKGMAGLALERKEPVHTCNLKEDKSGNVKPGAKAVDAQAAVAIPILDSAGSVAAVVGIAFHEERDITGAELQELMQAASTLPFPV
jgi:L-methionine (R)-S-oxide reductase